MSEKRSTPPGSTRTGLLLALAAALVSGVAVYANGRAVRHFPSPTVYTTAKNLVAGALLVMLALAVARRRAPTTHTSSQRTMFVAVALIGGAIPFVLFFEGLARATSNDAAFIHKTLVVWAAVLATVFLRERLEAVHIVAIALLVVGHAALAGGISSLHAGVGETMILLATLCWSIELILVKRLAAEIPSTDIAAVRLGGGSLLLVAWVITTGRFRELTGLSASQWAWVALTAAILATFVTLWFAALARAGVIDVTAILVLGAVVTGLINAGVGTIDITPEFAGNLLIFVGVSLVVAHASARPQWT